jgi:putative membrane protein
MFRKSIIAAGVLLVSTQAYATSASHFLSDAIKGDNSEVRLGQLIASRGHSSAVRRFGNTLVADHSKARGQAVAVARRMHVGVPAGMMPEARTEYAKLERLHGVAFDREVRRYMINDHRKDISDFADQARRGDRQTASLASAQLPTLRKHLRIAESLRN